jgi:hypothetical protein
MTMKTVIITWFVIWPWYGTVNDSLPGPGVVAAACGLVLLHGMQICDTEGGVGINIRT